MPRSSPSRANPIASRKPTTVPSNAPAAAPPSHEQAPRHEGLLTVYATPATPRGYQNNHILLFDQAAILSSRPALSRAGARSGRQGWPQATAQRLVLDGREHDGTIEADRTTLSPLTPWPAEPMSPSIGPSSQPLTSVCI